jgi:hypothetical protein
MTEEKNTRLRSLVSPIESNTNNIKAGALSVLSYTPS